MVSWRPSWLLAVAAGLLAATIPAAAGEVRVAPGTPLQPVIDAAEPGAVLRLDPGEHAGPVTIARPLVLEGAEGAVLAGPGDGSVVSILAPGVTVRGLTIRGSGNDLAEMESGVFVGPRFVVRGATPVVEKPSRRARDAEAAERLWRESVEQSGLDPAAALGA